MPHKFSQSAVQVRQIVQWVLKSDNTGFSIESQATDDSIASYFPDFVVKKSEKEFWIVETRGREDLNDQPKMGAPKNVVRYCECGR